MEFQNLLEAFQQEKNNILLQEKGTLFICNQMLAVCDRYLKKLKQTLLKKGFKNGKREIRFFRHIKPVIMGSLFYYLDVRRIEVSLSEYCKKNNKKLLARETKEVRKFLRENNDFVRYIKFDYTHLDKQIFTLQENVFVPKDNHVYYLDPEFSSSHSGLLARLKSHQALLIYLKQKLLDIEEKDKIPTSFEKLQWTGSKAALIELAYALHHGRVVDNGNIDIKKLIQSFETLFNIQLSDPYKIYSEIKHRQKTKTKFLEELTLNMQRQIEQEC